MPRIKLENASKRTKNRANYSETKELEYFRKELTDSVTVMFTKHKLELDTNYQQFVDAIDTVYVEELAQYSHKELNKTLGELRKERSLTSNSTQFFDTTSILKHLDTTKNSTIATTTKKKLTEDEAGELGRSRSNERTRSTQRKCNTTVTKKRVSRSLSRSKLPKNVTIKAPAKTTPQGHRFVPPPMGYVTPKVKANTPLAVLRRPRQGELAISMQGSPLLVNNVVADSCANVNIPLMDGRIISLQPTNLLRTSDIPDLDDETRKQLKTLRDNLNKVVMFAKNM